MKKLSRLTNTSLLLSIDALVAALFTGIFWIIAARLVSTDLIGTTTTTISAASLLALVARLGHDFSIPYFVPKVAKVRPFLRKTFIESSCAALGLGALFLISLTVWLPDLHFLIETPLHAALFLAITLCLTLINLFLASGLILQRIPWVIGQDLVQNLLRIPIWLALFFSGHGNSGTALIGTFTLTAFLSVVLGFLAVYPHHEPALHAGTETSVNSRGYSQMSQLTSVLATAPGFALPLLINQLLGAEQVAVFSVAWMGLSALIIVHSAIASTLFAEGSRAKERLTSMFPRTMFITWGLQAAMFVGVLVLGKPVLRLFGPYYANHGYPLLILLALGTFFLAGNDYLIAIYRAHAKLKEVTGILGLIAILLVGLSLIFLPGSTIITFGWIFVAAQGITFVWKFTTESLHPLRTHGTTQP